MVLFPFLWFTVGTSMATVVFFGHRIDSVIIFADLILVVLSVLVNATILVWSCYCNNWRDDDPLWLLAFTFFLHAVSFFVAWIVKATAKHWGERTLTAIKLSR